MENALLLKPEETIDQVQQTPCPFCGTKCRILPGGFLGLHIFLTYFCKHFRGWGKETSFIRTKFYPETPLEEGVTYHPIFEKD